MTRRRACTTGGLGPSLPHSTASSTSSDSIATWWPQPLKAHRERRTAVGSRHRPVARRTRSGVSTSRCSPGSLAATGAWAPKSCGGFGGRRPRRVRLAPAHGRRIARHGRSDRGGSGTRPPGSVRPGNVRRREREERAARDRYLTGLAKRERQAWQRVDSAHRHEAPRRLRRRGHSPRGPARHQWPEQARRRVRTTARDDQSAAREEARAAGSPRKGRSVERPVHRLRWCKACLGFELA